MKGPGGAEGQDVDEKTRSCPWRSGLIEWRGSLANPHQRSDQPTRERTCRSATGVPTAPRAERPTQPTCSLRERRANHQWCRSTTSSFASEKTNLEISAEQVVTPGPMVTISMATFCGRGAVAATQCSMGAIAYLAAFLMGQLAAWGLGSGALVVRADQETSLTTLLDEIKARRAETLAERTAVESHQSVEAVERMNREVVGLLRTHKAADQQHSGAGS